MLRWIVFYHFKALFKQKSLRAIFTAFTYLWASCVQELNMGERGHRHRERDGTRASFELLSAAQDGGGTDGRTPRTLERWARPGQENPVDTRVGILLWVVGAEEL